MEQFPFRSCSYYIMPAPSVDAAQFMAPETQEWVPDASLPLDQALPSAWDPEYVEVFQQNFQPVKFWRNANIIAHYVRMHPGTSEAKAATSILRRLIDRMQEYIVETDAGCWVENRFDFIQPGVNIPGPWYSGIANAFVILGIRRCLDALGQVDTEECNGLRDLVRRLADSYRLPYVEGQGGPDRWISFVCESGNLWFEEYPMPNGQPNIVLNGHIFALLALNEARHIWPKDGYGTLISAGALSVAERFFEFQRRGKTTLYSLRGPRKGDYMPVRTVRQQFELFLLTGDDRFLTYACRTTVDIAQSVDPLDLRRSVDDGVKVINKRLRYDDRVRKRNAEQGLALLPVTPEPIPALRPSRSFAQRLIGVPGVRRIGRGLTRFRRST